LSDWVRAHGWGYSPELAFQTIFDIRRKLGVKPHERILEVGCASGFVLSSLLSEGQSGVGIDYTESLVRRASEFGVDPERVHLAVGEAAALPLPAAAFDRVLCYSVFPNFGTSRYAIRAMQELIRVCRPGGTILIGDVTGHWEGLRGSWRQHGFGIKSARAALRLPGLAPLRYALLPLRLAKSAVRRLRRIQSAPDDWPDFRLYSHRFFRRIGCKLGCRVEILPQDLSGRMISLYRFDVRLSKPAIDAGR
jgi:SAM-dependent methyltransferase